MIDGMERVTERRGKPWGHDECLELVARVRSGLADEEIAAAHGRSVNSVRARAMRILGSDRPRTRAAAIPRLRERLAVAGEDWRDPSTRTVRIRPRVADETDMGVGGPFPPEDIDGIGLVLAVWEAATATELDPELRSVFRARAETTALAGFPRHTLLATARDLVGRRGRLRLTTWLAACRGYDAAALAPPPAADEPDEGFAEVRELIAATVEDLAHERHRLVLGRRLDLDSSGAATLAELGVTLGVTRERVRQVQEQALREVAAASRDVRRPAARLAAVLASMLGADTAVEAAQRGADAVGACQRVCVSA